jgi:VCBS repeat-containing protein
VTFTDSADGFTTPNFQLETNASHGTATINAAGNWNYTPASNYNGSDSFTVKVTDNAGNVETQMISITVTEFLLDSADFDGDGDVDGRDFLAWQRGYGASSATKADGDANNNLKLKRVSASTGLFVEKIGSFRHCCVSDRTPS